MLHGAGKLCIPRTVRILGIAVGKMTLGLTWGYFVWNQCKSSWLAKLVILAEFANYVLEFGVHIGSCQMIAAVPSWYGPVVECPLMN